MKKNQRLLHFIKKTDAVLAKIEDAFSMLCMTGMVIAVLVGVALRFIFRMPNPYGEEISRYLLIAAVFIGISLAQRERAHLGIDNLVMVLPQKWAKRLRCFTDFLSNSKMHSTIPSEPPSSDVIVRTVSIWPFSVNR